MPFKTGTASADSLESANRNFIRELRRYLTGAADIGTVTYVGTGNGVIGKIDTNQDAPAETWTVTLTSATAFTVSGSVSGAQANGTVDTNYTSDSPAGRISFRIEAGSTAFVNLDAFTIPVTAGALRLDAKQWDVDRFDPFSSDLETILHGPGSGGLDEIYVGFRIGTENSPTNQWNIELRGFTGFNSGANFVSQPGTSLGYHSCLWDQDTPFWFVMDGRFFTWVADVNNVYQSQFGGFIDAFATDDEWPYPLMVGANSSTEVGFDNTGGGHRMWWDPDDSAAIRAINGNWINMDQGISGEVSVWPYGNAGGGGSWIGQMQTCIDATYPLFPIVLIHKETASTAFASGEIFGEVPHAFGLPGFSQSAESTITIATVDHITFPNVFRVGRDDFFALRLE